MGTSIHKKASSPVKFLGQVGDNIRQGFDDIMYGHLPPPPEHVNPNIGDVRIGDTFSETGSGVLGTRNLHQQQLQHELQESLDPRNDPANSPREQLRRAWADRGGLFSGGTEGMF